MARIFLLRVYHAHQMIVMRPAGRERSSGKVYVERNAVGSKSPRRSNGTFEPEILRLPRIRYANEGRSPCARRPNCRSTPPRVLMVSAEITADPNRGTVTSWLLTPLAKGCSLTS